MAASSEGTFGSRLLRAMKHPFALGSAVGAVVAGVFAPVFAIPFALIWGVSVAVLATRHAPGTPKYDISHLPPSLQADLLGVTTALDQLQEALRSVPNEQRPMFEGIEREAEKVRTSVLNLALNAGTLHRRLEATRLDEGGPANDERRERLLARLTHYRAILQSLETTAGDLTDRAVYLAAGTPIERDILDEHSPERNISEMKASMAALEEVMRTDTETL